MPRVKVASPASTFVPNQRLPVHRWFRYSAGFSGAWAEAVVRAHATGAGLVLDPFAGVATTLVAAQLAGRPAVGLEAHPFVARLAEAKLCWTADPGALERAGAAVLARARRARANVGPPPADLLGAAYAPEALAALSGLAVAIEGETAEGTPERRLCWLALAAILRACSSAGTAPWQYVLPRKTKARIAEPAAELAAQLARMVADMRALGCDVGVARVFSGDARTCAGVEDGAVDLVVTSPPYPNNYDYADATRLEQTFFGEVRGWGDLQAVSRRFLVRACSQHAAAERLAVAPLVADAAVAPIAGELGEACAALGVLRRSRAGHKAYDAMIAAYFVDLARVLAALARVVRPGGKVCFVVGDSAPYGVHVPALDWLVRLAERVGFSLLERRRVRLRNVKWKNRKHRVPLEEAELWWVRG